MFKTAITGIPHNFLRVNIGTKTVPILPLLFLLWIRQVDLLGCITHLAVEASIWPIVVVQ